MGVESFVLTGRQVRLEPLGLHHVEPLLAAAAVDPSIYKWTVVPQSLDAMTKYVKTGLAMREAGTAAPLVTTRRSDGAVLGCTRFWNIERWLWPEGHARLAEATYDACEIGHTWLTRDAIRTAVNTEAKLLMLTHAFEVWKVLRVSLCTDLRNEQSAAAIARIGGKLDGTLRSHRLASDITPRTTLWFSILDSEWPDAKAKLQARLAQA